MLSTKYNFLFIHVPKTGGNSIQNILSNYSDDKIVCLAPHQDGLERFEVRSKIYKTHKHSTLSDYRREYGDKMSKGLFTFCCVRNPWERVVSHYFSPHRGVIAWEKDNFLRFIRSSEVKPLRFFIAEDGLNENNLQHGIDNMSKILRFETIQADFDDVCKLLGLPCSELPHRNKSTRDEYTKYFDTNSAEAVFNKFHDEISHFGYSLT